MSKTSAFIGVYPCPTVFNGQVRRIKKPKDEKMGKKSNPTHYANYPSDKILCSVFEGIPEFPSDKILCNVFEGNTRISFGFGHCPHNLDKMWCYVEKTQKLWTRKARRRNDGTLVDWEYGDRCAATLRKLTKK